MNINKDKGPIIIGGLGGSGTRIVAEILKKFGYYMGNDLNIANDNLLYTLLLKRPRWFYKNFENKTRIKTGIKLFHKLMVGGKTTIPENYFLLNAVITTAVFGRNLTGGGQGLSWPIERIHRLFQKNNQMNTQHVGWGWKEPNSYMLIDEFAEYFPNYRYIHTIRHGLDMAFSANQQQLYNWGPFFDVDIPESRLDEARSSYKFWINVNQKILNFSERVGDDRVLFVIFDDLCLSPQDTIQKIMAFLDVEVDKEIFQEALEVPKPPGSMGRYKKEDFGLFDQADLEYLKHFGFKI